MKVNIINIFAHPLTDLKKIKFKLSSTGCYYELLLQPAGFRSKRKELKHLHSFVLAITNLIPPSCSTSVE